MLDICRITLVEPCPNGPITLQLNLPNCPLFNNLNYRPSGPITNTCRSVRQTVTWWDCQDKFPSGQWDKLRVRPSSCRTERPKGEGESNSLGAGEVCGQLQQPGVPDVSPIHLGKVGRELRNQNDNGGPSQGPDQGMLRSDGETQA